MDVVIAELGTRRFAVDLAAVQEVLRLGPVTPVPAAPAVVIGAMNARGSVVPIVDLGLLLGEGASTPSMGESGLLIDKDDSQAVLYLGWIHEVVRLRSTQQMGTARAGGFSEVLATEQGTLHLVHVERVIAEVLIRVKEQAQRLMSATVEREGKTD